jgi:CRP/FNR family cyclic AMP-dependent transcriptional regulator
MSAGRRAFTAVARLPQSMRRARDEPHKMGRHASAPPGGGGEVSSAGMAQKVRRQSPRPAAARGVRSRSRRGSASRQFDAQAFLDTAGVARKVVTYDPHDIVFSQGDPCDAVMYLQAGQVKLSVLSARGKEAVVAVLGPGAFFGEGALAGQLVRMATATAMQPSTLLVIQKRQMARVLHEQPELADRFIAHLLARNIRIEEDLVDQLFNSSEKRLARALLLLARYGKHDRGQHVLPRPSQELLAEIVGTTRSRVNFFMNKFRKLGLIEYNGSLIVRDSLVSVVLHD